MAFLEQHRAWVEKRLAHYQRPPQPHDTEDLPTKIILPALEQHWQITYLPAQKTKLRANHHAQTLVVEANGQTRDKTVQALQKWLQQYAHQVLADRLFDWSERMNLPYKKVQIRRQQTRWGSCSSQGHINLNAKLMFLPAECIDYVIVHELCHLVHMNHSRRFWALVAKHYPNYKAAKYRLAQAKHRIPSWAH